MGGAKTHKLGHDECMQEYTDMASKNRHHDSHGNPDKQTLQFKKDCLAGKYSRDASGKIVKKAWYKFWGGKSRRHRKSSKKSHKKTHKKSRHNRTRRNR
jgi:hypothetical protein